MEANKNTNSNESNSTTRNFTPSPDLPEISSFEGYNVDKQNHINKFKQSQKRETHNTSIQMHLKANKSNSD